MGGDGGKTISSSIVIFRVKETDTVASAANSLANVRDFGFVAKTTKKGSDSPRPNVAEVGKVTAQRYETGWSDRRGISIHAFGEFSDGHPVGSKWMGIASFATLSADVSLGYQVAITS
jgi:hypothetical protein